MCPLHFITLKTSKYQWLCQCAAAEFLKNMHDFIERALSTIQLDKWPKL